MKPFSFRYQDIGERFKFMSKNVEDLKTAGMKLIEVAERYIDVEPIQNEISSIGEKKKAFGFVKNSRFS